MSFEASAYLSWKSGYMSVNHRQISYTCQPPLFSERYGFEKPILRICAFRVFYRKSNWRSYDSV